MPLKLNPRHDGFGWLYGAFLARVEIMPPEAHWAGDARQGEKFAPDQTQWAVYVDGDHVASVDDFGGIEAAVIEALGRGDG